MSEWMCEAFLPALQIVQFAETDRLNPRYIDVAALFRWHCTSSLLSERGRTAAGATCAETVGTQNAPAASMEAHTLSKPAGSITGAENWFALGAGALLLVLGASRRSFFGSCLALSSTALLYRGVTGHWPRVLDGSLASDDTKAALRGTRGINVRESIRLELPVADVYRFWRRLENLPRFMYHLDRVEETSDRHSHWVAAGPAGLTVAWDAEIINEIENKLIAWRSLPGSEVTTAGSVNFETARGGRSTQISVNLQYAPPAGKAGALIASLFGREPSQTIREDLRRLKRLLEAGDGPGTPAVA
jgi:uncharacterized membrane protein